MTYCPLGQVEQDQRVAERVGHHRQPADRDVARPGQDPPAGRPDRLRRLVGEGNEPVRFVTLTCGEDDLRVTVGQGQASLADVVIAPASPTARRVTTPDHQAMK